MVDKKKIMSMCDKFIDSKELSTEELLGLDFTSNEINELIENGTLKKQREDLYEFCDAGSMLYYARWLFNRKNVDRCCVAQNRALEIDPGNWDANIRVFCNSLFEENYAQAFKCLDVMMETDNIYYLQDQNFWLYLLNFITEIPEKYKEKVKNMTFEDICVLDDDARYKTANISNAIRRLMMRYELTAARKFYKNTSEYNEKKIYSAITSRLLHLIRVKDKKAKSEYAQLINEKKYFELFESINEKHSKRELSYFEKCLFVLVKDLVSVINDKRVLEKIDCVCENDFYAYLCSRQYDKALELNNEYREKNNYEEDSLSVLLGVIIFEIEKLKEDRKNASSYKDEITLNLASQQITVAIDILDVYLKLIDKSEYKNFVVDLIKLDFIEGDVNFSESLFALEQISAGDCDFDLSIYTHPFYFELANGNFQKASIYLDLLSMSNFIGNIHIDTESMREMFDNKLKQASLETKDLEVSFSVNNDEISDDIVDEFCCLSDVFGDVINTKGIAMLAPLNEKDAAKVLAISENVENVDSIVVDEADGSKRIFFKYFNARDKYVPIKTNLIRADRQYKIGAYENCIDLYEEILPKISTPRGFVYARLGMCYYNLVCDNDFSKAIDYLTLASICEADAYEDYEFKELLSNMKTACGYDGVKVKFDSSEASYDHSKSVQYKKEN